MSAPALARLRFGPSLACVGNVFSLPFVCFSAEQDHLAIRVAAEIDAIPWREVDVELEHALYDALEVGRAAGAHARQRRSDPGSRRLIEIIGRVSARAPSAAVQILSEFEYYLVTHT